MNSKRVFLECLLVLLSAALHAESRKATPSFRLFTTGERSGRTVPNGRRGRFDDNTSVGGPPRAGCCLPKVFRMKQYSTNYRLGSTTTWAYVDGKNTRQAFRDLDDLLGESWLIALYHPDTLSADFYQVDVNTKRCTHDNQTGIRYADVCLPETVRLNATFTIGGAPPARIKANLWLLPEGAGEILATVDQCVPVTVNSGGKTDTQYFGEFEASVDPKVFVPPKYCP